MSQSQRPNPPDDARTQALRDELEQTRAALAAKLELLEERLTQSVNNTRSTVEGTMSSVKQTAHDALQSIKLIYDLKQAGKHPWSVAGIASCIGIMLAQRGYRRAQAATQTPPPPGEVHPQLPPAAAEPEPESTKKWLGSRLRKELHKLQSVALGVGVDLVRDWVKRKSPGARNNRNGE